MLKRLNIYPKRLLLSVAVMFAGLYLISCDISEGEKVNNFFSYQYESQAAIISDTTRRQLTPDSSVTVYNFSVQPGENLVFTHRHRVEPPDNVVDGGLTENLVFQVPASANQFEFRDEALGRAPVFYRRVCFCPLSGTGFKVSDGFIRGEKLSPVHWIIRANVSIAYLNETFHIEFEEPFYLK